MAGPSPTTRADDQRAIYEQDGEFVRHRANLSWSRFQLVAVIEGAALYVRYLPESSVALGLQTMIAATVVIALIFGLAFSDILIARSHLRRMIDFEGTRDAPFPATKGGSQLSYLNIFAMGLIIGVNVGLIIGPAVGL